MRLTIHNALMRFCAPAVQAVLLALAVAVMALPASAQDVDPPPQGPFYQMFSLDDPQCGVCKAWDDTAKPLWDELPEAVWIPHDSILYSKGYRPVKEEWPDWLREGIDQGRIQYVPGTPTFIFVNLETMTEVARIVGYSGNPADFYERVVVILEAIQEHQP